MKQAKRVTDDTTGTMSHITIPKWPSIGWTRSGSSWMSKQCYIGHETAVAAMAVVVVAEDRGSFIGGWRLAPKIRSGTKLFTSKP
jgi:hypothetical protein